MITEKDLSTIYYILVKIYKYTEIKKEPIYFSKILKDVNLPKSHLSTYISWMYDKIMIDSHEYKLKDGSKVLGFVVSKNFLPFVKGLYNTTSETKTRNKELSK